MINKIKQLMKTDEIIEAINRKIDSTNNNIEELNMKVENSLKEINSLKSEQAELLKALKSNSNETSGIMEALKAEIFEFKLLKSQLQRKLLEKFEEELKKELSSGIDIMRRDAEEYNEARKNLNETMKKMNSINEDVAKFIDISRSIKKEDFHLSNFAKQVSYADSEKIRLMRRVEQLEGIISKMRRNEKHSHQDHSRN